MSYTYPFPMVSIGIDAIVIKEDVDQMEDSVLLIQRKCEPYKGMWALVGVFVEQDEFIIDAVKREVKEEIGLVLANDQPSFFTYVDTPNRDPRQRTISFVYDIYITEEEAKSIVGGDDAENPTWFLVRDIIDHKIQLAFDHQEILDEYFAVSGLCGPQE